jgi:DNA-binding response OmpR family regulator
MNVDILLLAVEWRTRALLRAELIESGFEVFATDNSSDARGTLHSPDRPRLVVVDLQNLPDPASILAELRDTFNPSRVLILNAGATVPPEQLAWFGFRVLARPMKIGSIVATVKEMWKG